jgi:hypothetical protein
MERLNQRLLTARRALSTLEELTGIDLLGSWLSRMLDKTRSDNNSLDK